MNPLTDSTSLSIKALKPIEESNNPAQPQTQHHEKSGKQVANHRQSKGKNTAAYWQSRIFKPVNDRGIASPHYSMKVAYKGRRMAFGTGTGNKEAAAQKAAGIYNDLVVLGVEGTLAKHRPQTAKGEKIATVGEWITAAREVSEANDATFTAYARALRLIAGGVATMKKDTKRFGPKKGGSTKYREAIDSMSLEALSPVAIQKWRLAYAGKAKNPAQEKSAKTSCNSTIRQARSLFAPKVLRFLPNLRLPAPAPFIGVEFYERQNTKYFSKIDAPAIVLEANTKLSTTDSQAFLAFLLAIGAGLRRSEIDTLCWHQIDTKRGLIRVENTEVASLKTNDSRGEVAIDGKLATELQGLKAKHKAKDADFVIKGDGAEGKRGWGQHYRAGTVFDALIKWLRSYEQEGKKPLEAVRKPIHELRKELGALITSKHGIYAASQALRHSTVATTAAYYAAQKERTTVGIGDWLSPAENVIQIPELKPQEPKISKKKASR
jgi:integrase